MIQKNWQELIKPNKIDFSSKGKTLTTLVAEPLERGFGIVVALINEETATLKRFRKNGGSIALEAANPAFGTQIFGPDHVRIQGKLVALVRRYH